MQFRVCRDFTAAHIYSCQKVARHKLWYTKSDHVVMALAISENVLKLRVTGALNVGVDEYMSNKIDVSYY